MGDKMEMQKNFKPIIEQLQKSARVEIVFGEMIETKDKSIIPVACVGYGFGGGAGKGGMGKKDTDKPQGEGQGGCGGVASKPMGIFEITEEKTRFVPVITFKEILIGVFGLLIFWRFFRK